jgi:hypothetical protein
MRKLTWVIVTGLALLAGAAASNIPVLLIGAGMVGVYLVICRLAPRTRHITWWGGCNGTGEAHSRLFPWGYHRCDGCNGTGRHIRLGARLVGPPHARAAQQASRATRAQRHQTHSWR